MSTTIDALKQTTPSMDAEPQFQSADTGVPEAKGGVMATVAGGLFFLDVVIVSLALGQLVIWCTTMAVIEPPGLMLSLCDAVFSTALVMHRLPHTTG